MKLTGQAILVTGATGFIGGRICERLIQAGHTRVRALVRDARNASRIARLPVEIVRGDLLERESLRHAIGDAGVVIHSGLGQGRAIVTGTRNMLSVAHQAGVARFVHISTAAVYGLRPGPGCETETAIPRRTGDVYCDNKLLAERVVCRFVRKGMPVVILRPSIVYGPYSRWCTRLANGLREGRITLIDGGRGICNTTYVDNLVDAIFLAVEHDCGVGRTFFITDGERVTWADFISAHVAMLDSAPKVGSITKDEILRYHRERPGLLKGSLAAARQVLVSREFRELMKRIPLFETIIQRLWFRLQNMSEAGRDRLWHRLAGSHNPGGERTADPVIPDLATLATQTGEVQFSIDKARQVLGYAPRVAFADGMRRCEQWLRFANYLDS